MARKSRREIEAALDDLDSGEQVSIHAYLWADLKAAYGGRLTTQERAILDSPEEHLSPTARATLDL